MKRAIWLSCLFYLAPSIIEGALFMHIGPEFYYFQRHKEGGTNQSGILEAGRVTAEWVKPFGFYLGFDAFWGGGSITGKSASGRKLCSEITDYIVEGRLGYTLLSGSKESSLFTIYGGYGYFYEQNAFQAPSPIQYICKDTFNFASLGFFSSHNFSALLSMGLNFEVKFMLNGESNVSNDPLFEDVRLEMNNELQARIEVPCTYRNWARPSWNWEAQLVPFYEYRHFGGREDYPFNFIDTQFNLIGLRASIGIRY